MKVGCPAMNKPFKNLWIADPFGEPLGVSWQQEGDEWVHHLRGLMAAKHGGNFSMGSAPASLVFQFPSHEFGSGESS
jgi:hypothetical protein